MSFVSMIGNDCLDIISGYKTDLDNYEKQLSSIFKCVTTDEELHFDYTECPILLSDFKKYFNKHNFTNKIRFQMKHYGNRRDNTLFTLDFMHDIEENVLNKTEIVEMIKFGNTIYLKLAPFKLEPLVESKKLKEVIDMEDDEEDVDMNNDDDMDIDWNDLI